MGNPIVAWMELSVARWNINVRRWNGSAWTEIGPGSTDGLGVTAGGAVRSCALVVDGAGWTMVAWSAGEEIYTRRTGAPTATLTVNDITRNDVTSQTMTVCYVASPAIRFSSLGDGDLRVSGPGGYEQLAHLVSVDASTDNTLITATYRITPPKDVWTKAGMGTYFVSLEPAQVILTAGVAIPTGILGSSHVQFSLPKSATDPLW